MNDEDGILNITIIFLAIAVVLLIPYTPIFTGTIVTTNMSVGSYDASIDGYTVIANDTKLTSHFALLSHPGPTYQIYYGKTMMSDELVILSVYACDGDHCDIDYLGPRWLNINERFIE